MLAQTRKEQADLIRGTKEQCDRMLREAAERSQAEADRIIEKAREAVRDEKARALGEIREETVRLSVAVAEKVLRRELSGHSAKEEFADKMIKESFGAEENK